MDTDADLGRECEGIVAMRTRFDGEAPYVGNEGVLLALNESLDELDRLQKAYPHFCQDGHPPIGHSDSEHEMCPLCRVVAIATRMATDRTYERGDAVEHLREVLGEFDGLE